MTHSVDDIRQRTWDFALTIITIVLLAALGTQSFAGTIIVWLSIRTIPQWQQGSGYADYVTTMNVIAAPIVVALVVVMGLCVPKRLFSRRFLLWVSLAMVAVGALAGFVSSSLATGLAVYLMLSAAIQLAVVVMTVAGVRGPSYLTEGRLTKTGSGLLHLGFIVFAIVVVALQKSPMMAPVFWLSAVLVTLGTALAFYAHAIAWPRAPHGEEAAFEWTEGDSLDSAPDEGVAPRDNPTTDESSQ
jgi:hypothetical protein